MRRILASRHLRTLEVFANSNVVVAFDFDGTLAPVVDSPDRASMRNSTRRRLTAVARLYPVAVISGRSRLDVSRRLGAVPVCQVTGNHGMEPWGERPEYKRLVRDWAVELEAEFGGRQGVYIENKTYSLTLHYRGARGKADVARRARQLASSLRGARVVSGVESIAIVPSDAPHKGAALERIRDLLACDTAIYVGDDETDEDAFGSGDPDRLLAIRVGARRDSRAAYCLTSQGDVDALLAVLIACRRTQRPPLHKSAPLG